MSNPMEKPMDKEGMKALIERTRAHQAEFIARNPDFRAEQDEQEARIAEATRATPATTAAASKRFSKKKQRDFPTFIEKSLPPRDRE